MSRCGRRLAVFAALIWLLATRLAHPQTEAQTWTPFELDVLRSLSLASLGPPPDDPSNRVASDPRAAELGERLFFDTRLSANAEVACASCHQPERYFTDGLALAQGIGTTKRGAPSLLGTAHSPWLYWDGRRDSHWAQALVPLETPEEHGMDRRDVVRVVREEPHYRTAYEALFGPLPADTDDSPGGRAPELDTAFANIGKAIAAFERTLEPGAARFDAFVVALSSGDGILTGSNPKSILTDDELAGLRLFISEDAQCTRCHNGPLFTNFGFHNIGLIEYKRGVRDYDFGRARGSTPALEDPFNCLGEFSDAEPDQCPELNYLKTQGRELMGAFKVPTLRNVAETAPYMHDGRFATLREVLTHYRDAPPKRMGHQELNPLELTDAQLGQIEAFLGTLTQAAQYPTQN